MAFFQNVFAQEFRGAWLLDDRQYSLDFNINANVNRDNYQYAWFTEPYNFTTNNTLTINYAYDVNFKNYSALAINVASLTTPAATTAAEVCSLLNANATFSEYFIAQPVNPSPSSVTPSVLPPNIVPPPPWAPLNPPQSVLITKNTTRIPQNIRVWISNTGAEVQMRFNWMAPVNQLPTYFSRHTIANRFTPASVGMLVELNPSDPNDEALITNAGFNYLNMLSDWQLLTGRASGLFMFQNINIDGLNRTTSIIEYPAGAAAGDFAKRIDYLYTGSNPVPSQITEIPYVLQSGDLVMPPYNAAVAIVAAGGINYAVGDTITLTGGTFSSAIVLVVTAINAGVITTVNVQTSGSYTVKPTNPVAQGASSGIGTGATFNITWN